MSRPVVVKIKVSQLRAGDRFPKTGRVVVSNAQSHYHGRMRDILLRGTDGRELFSELRSGMEVWVERTEL
jgi:hypothetical protein